MNTRELSAITREAGHSATYQTPSALVTIGARNSAFLMAYCFGTISPKTRRRSVNTRTLAVSA